MRDFFVGVTAAILGLFNIGQSDPTQPAVYRVDQPAAAVIAQASFETTNSFLSQLPLISCADASVVDCLAAQGLPFDVDFRAALMRELGLAEEPGTVAGNAALRDALNTRAAAADIAPAPSPSTPSPTVQSIAQPVIVHEVLAQNAVTREELDAALAALRADLLSAMQRSLPSVYTIVSPAPAAPVSITTFAHSQRIDQLGNVTITNATVNGVTGLTDTDIPDGITASNYMPISGGTFIGALTLPYLIATSSSATSTFAAGLEASNLNLTGTAATSTASNGFNLSAGCFAVNGVCVGSGSGSGTVSSGTQGQFAFYNAAGTTLTATSSLFLSQAGNVGIGTTSPSTKLAIAGDLVVASSTSAAFTKLFYPTNKEMVLQASNDNLNVLVLQNTSGTNSFSAVAFRGNDNVERGAVGFGNSTAGSPFTNSTYIEASYYTGASHTTAPAPLKFVQTGYLNGSYGSFLRQSFDASGNTKFYKPDGTTEHLVIKSRGGLYIGSDAATNAGNMLSIRGDSTTFATDSNGFSSLLRLEQTGDASAALLYSPNTFTDTDGLLRVHMDGNSSTGPALTVRQDGSGNLATFSNASTDLLVVKSSGSVGVGTTTPWRTLSVTGTVGFDGLTSATGAGSLCLSANREVVYNSGSDSCLSSTRATKHDIALLTLDALAQVVALNPVSFIYNNDASSTVRYGFIAEDAAAVDPHLATYDAQGTISGIDDRSIISIVVKAVQELSGKITGILDRLSGHDTQIAALEARIAALEASQGAAGAGGGLGNSPAPGEDAPDTEPPTITINGNNPATLNVGDTYNDLGATVTDNVDLNLGYQIFVGSTPLDQAVIDTNEPNEWHIHYVATDNAANTATSTRTVIVEPPSIAPEPEPELQEEEALTP